MDAQSETPFRIAIAVLLVVTMVVGVYHRVQAARSGERISRRDEGLLFAVCLRALGLCLWIATLLYLLAPNWIAWASLPLPAAVRWSGIVAGAIAWGLFVWTLRHLGKNLTDTVVTRAAATLVTSGPYRYVRHPFYVSAALLMLSVSLMAANGAMALAGVAVMAMLVIRTPNEEQHLLAKFGESYHDYMKATGRFIPRFGSKSRQ